MYVAIVSNIQNGIGLQKDYELLRGLLEQFGHEVVGIQYDAPRPDGLRYFDLAIFLETMPATYLKIAKTNWAFLNPEWTRQDMVRIAENYMSRILCKTKEAERILKPIFPDKTFFTGFMSEDHYDARIRRFPKFLHIGGNSSWRGTQEVIDAWWWKKNGLKIEADLTVVSKAVKEQELPERVTLVKTVEDLELRFLQNSHKFHLYPARTEGYGHAYHEAFGVRAVVVTTKAPPMDEMQTAYKIPFSGKYQHCLADLYEVSAINIHEAVQLVLDMEKRHGFEQRKTREEFEKCNAEFSMQMQAHLDDVKPSVLVRKTKLKPLGLKIAFLGNFDPQESTENMILWALENRLGHEVVKLQENRVTVRDLQDILPIADLFLWVRTPDFLKVSDYDMEAFLLELKENGIPSLSVHLDKFWGIPQRETLIGKIPFWKTAHVWTADGSRDKEFRERGVNHYWMQPAVSEVYCHPGTPRDEYRCSVGFVGARSYHSEYPFREDLLAFLEEEYGEDFKHITGLRGHGLNDFYASCKICVGDCFQAGTPRYWSDRVPETCGRGGFLLHPEVEGLDLPLAFYKPQNIDSLRKKIKLWLDHEPQREYTKTMCQLDVAKSHTWTVRMDQILKQVYR